MTDTKIIRIEWAPLEGERPRAAGSNARLGPHGRRVRSPIARITTNDGTTGLIVPPDSPQRIADAVKLLLSQPNLAAAMGAAGRRSALESFDVRSQAGHLADLYRHLTDQSAGSREGKTS